MLAFQGKLYTILVCRLLHAGTVCFRIGLRDCCPVRKYYVMLCYGSESQELAQDNESFGGGNQGLSSHPQANLPRL